VVRCSSYKLVGPAEASIARVLISLASPIGTALTGRRVGDNVKFASPGGERSATVVEVSTG
jgi:transcription elongation factor GreA